MTAHKTNRISSQPSTPPSVAEVEIRSIKIEDAPAISQLHVSGINTGFLSSLGLAFLIALYEAIASSKSAFGFVAQQNSQIIGFVFFTTDLNSLYGSVIRKKGIKFALLLAGELVTIRRIKGIFQTLLYPQRIKSLNLPATALIAMAVADSGRRRGLGSQLVKTGLKECAKRGIKRVRLFTSADNVAANSLYLKCGFKLVSQFSNHGILSNFYVVEVDNAIS